MPDTVPNPNPNPNVGVATEPPEGVQGADAQATGKFNFIPLKPKMGGLEQIGHESYAAWTGGKPNVTWTNLEESDPTDIEPTQYRPTNVTGAVKNQTIRITGESTKHTKDADLLTFQKDVMDHLTNYGLDTITYLADPQDKESMVSIVTHQAKYNPREVTALEASQKELYDKHDNANIRDAKKYLMKSLSPDLKKQMNETCQDNDTFIAYWMNLMILVRPVSIRQFEKIKNRLKSRKIKNYPGENVKTISSDFLSDYKELEGAGMYDHILTYSMLNIIMEGGGSNNEDFRSPLRTLKDRPRVHKAGGSR